MSKKKVVIIGLVTLTLVLGVVFIGVPIATHYLKITSKKSNDIEPKEFGDDL